MSCLILIDIVLITVFLIAKNKAMASLCLWTLLLLSIQLYAENFFIGLCTTVAIIWAQKELMSGK